MKCCLVTGGAGFLGSHVADALLAGGHHVVVLDDLSGGSRDNVPAAAVFVQGSILDRDLLALIFARYQINRVFHLAAYAAEGLSHFIRRFNYENNLLGSVNLVNLAVEHEVECFVFTSSIAVYGRNQVPMDEECEPRPEDPYGVAKYAVEMDLAAAREVFGLPSIIFRPHNVYGERQNIGDRYRNVIGIFMNQILRGERLSVFGDGSQKRAFTHVADVAPVIASAVDIPEARNRVFNIGADIPYSINDLVAMIGRAFGIEPRVEYLPARHEVLHAWARHERARNILGCEARIGLEEGICRMAEWVRAVGARQSGRFGALEIERGLPEVWLRS